MARVEASCSKCSTLNTMSDTWIGAPCLVCGTWVNAPPLKVPPVRWHA